MLLFWFLMPVLLVMVVAAVGLRLAVTRAAVQAAQSAVAEIEEAAREADGAGEIALVRGKLRIVGEGCNPPESDWTKGCAATTSWASESRLVRQRGEHVAGARAARLMIESREGLFELSGALEVRMGSRLSLGSGRDFATEKFLSGTALFEGDEVVAVGVPAPRPSDAHEGAADYRAAAGIAVLAPGKDLRLPIVATRLSRTTVAPSAMFSLAMLPAWLVAIAAGGALAMDSRTPQGIACRAHGACSWLFHTTKDADCHASSDCLKNGRCDVDQGRCVARSEADCYLSLNCLQYGSCLLSGDECTKAPDSHAHGCTGTDWTELKDEIQCDPEGEPCGGVDGAEACTPWRRPSPTRPRSCVDVECAASCAETTMCRRYGFCGASKEDFCVATEEGCASSERCRLHGVCSLGKGDRGCEPQGEDCQRSAACANHGWCLPTHYENGEDNYHHICFPRDPGEERYSAPPG